MNVFFIFVLILFILIIIFKYNNISVHLIVLLLLHYIKLYSDILVSYDVCNNFTVYLCTFYYNSNKMKVMK